MGSKPKKVKPQAPPPPQAIPEVAPESEDTEVRKAMKRGGYRKTILTGALAPMTGRKTVLGG